MAAGGPSNMVDACLLDKTGDNEVIVKLAKFEEALRQLEKDLQPALGTQINEIHEKLQPIDRAKFDLTMAFALNSLYWMYITLKGEDPEEHKINFGLQRIKNYMKSVEEIIAKETMPRLDTGAAKRFVKAALNPNPEEAGESSEKNMKIAKKSKQAAVNDIKKAQFKKKNRRGKKKGGQQTKN